MNIIQKLMLHSSGRKPRLLNRPQALLVKAAADINFFVFFQITPIKFTLF